MIPPSKWRWFGDAGHFIGAGKCRFHLTTEVGKFTISTVGNYFPDSAAGRVPVAGNCFYETMAFKSDGPRCNTPECGCGKREPKDWNELRSVRCNTGKEANANHLALCQLYAKKK